MSLKMQLNQFVELRNEIAIEFNSNKKKPFQCYVKKKHLLFLE